MASSAMLRKITPIYPRMYETGDARPIFPSDGRFQVSTLKVEMVERVPKLYTATVDSREKRAYKGCNETNESDAWPGVLSWSKVR